MYNNDGNFERITLNGIANIETLMTLSSKFVKISNNFDKDSIYDFYNWGRKGLDGVAKN